MFTDSYFPTIDGVVVSLTTTSRELRKRGHDVVIFAPQPIEKISEELSDRVIWLPARRFGKYQGYRMAIYPSSIVSLVRSERPDIIHSHGIGFVGIQGLLASRNTRVPNILTYHTMFIDAAPYYSPIPLPRDVMARLIWIYHRNYLRRPQIVTTPTRAIRDELILKGIRAKRWEITPTGVDCNRFSPAVSGGVIREHLGLDNFKMILTLGRIAKEKNLDLLLKGFSRLLQRRDEVRLVIGGDGPAIREYRSLTEKMGLAEKVIFTGFISNEELPIYYAACDAFAIASTFETQGIVALEAMACGKPVAGINFRAIPELIQHGENGYLFEGNPEACADALESAIDDRERVSLEARKTAEKFSLERCIDRLVDLYLNLAKSTR